MISWYVRYVVAYEYACIVVVVVVGGSSQKSGSKCLSMYRT